MPLTYSNIEILNDVYDAANHQLRTNASGGGGSSSSSVTIASGQVLTTLEQSRSASSANVHIPASNTASIVTISAAGSGVSNIIGGVAWSYSSPPASGNLKIEDGVGTTVFSIDITSAGPGFIPFARPMKGASNTALVVTLAAGGAGVLGKVNILSKWTE